MIDSYEESKKEWPFVSKKEFEKMREAQPYEWQRANGKKTRLYKEYTLYWSARTGGLWVANY